MSDQFLAEIRCFPFNFPPTGWAFCAGQLMPLSQNTALFALLGTVYGGDGKSTFALPDLQDRAPMHPNSPASGGLSQSFLGQTDGAETSTLLVSEIPGHTHQLSASDTEGDNPVPTGRTVGRYPGLYHSSANLQPMAPQALPPAGGGLPHNNMMPYLTLNFCIALQGVFPQRP